MEATIAQPAADPTPNQSSTLVPGLLLPLVAVDKKNPSSNQLTMASRATDPAPNQHSILVTGVTLPMDKKAACDQQVKLPQEETTPHTGQCVIAHGNMTQKLS